MSVGGCDFAVLTVQDAELNAVLGLVDVIHEDRSLPETLYRVRLLDSRITGVVMPVGGVGRVDAAIATSILLARSAPRYVYLIGIAGGFPANGVKLGDILVADQIVDYEQQRLTDLGSEPRQRCFSADPHLLAAAVTTADESKWRTKLFRVNSGQPEIHFGPILSGDKVIASEKLVSAFLRDNHRLIGVEMEGGGVAAAVRRRQTAVPLLMIRGVVDYANDQKREDSQRWLADACAATAAFTLATAAAAHDGI